SSFVEDSIRITGSQEFIDSVLACLKGMLEYEVGGSRLDPKYMQTTSRYKDENGKLVQGDLTGAWACYLRALSRGTGRRGRGKAKEKAFPATAPTPLPEATQRLPNGFKELPAPSSKVKVKALEPLEPLY